MTDSKTIRLPRLVSGRDFADEMVDAFTAAEGPLDGVHVVVDASNLLSGTASFAAQLVRRILFDANAAEMVLTGAPTQFAQDATLAASELEATARFDVAASLASVAS
ncbi:hypothetical protein ACXR2U_00960 [Jatrophihabitans sp. YIM 134969]